MIIREPVKCMVTYMTITEQNFNLGKNQRDAGVCVSCKLSWSVSVARSAGCSKGGPFIILQRALLTDDWGVSPSLPSAMYWML
jgi:hypothetical protein